VSFEHALGFVLSEEGGWSDDPVDAGGATLMGVTQGRYDAYRTARNLKRRSVSQATENEIRSIYGEEWESAKCSEWPSPVALVVLDTAVQRGPSRAIRDLQEAVGATADGLVGPKTRAAVNAAAPESLVHRLLIARSDHYVARVKAEPEQIRFLKGWMRRVVRLSVEAGRTL